VLCSTINHKVVCRHILGVAGFLTVKLLQTTAEYSHCCNNSKLRCDVDPDSENDKYEIGVARSIKAKFHYVIWFEAGSKLVADLQRGEIWLSSSLLAAN